MLLQGPGREGAGCCCRGLEQRALGEHVLGKHSPGSQLEVLRFGRVGLRVGVHTCECDDGTCRPGPQPAPLPRPLAGWCLGKQRVWVTEAALSLDLTSRQFNHMTGASGRVLASSDTELKELCGLLRLFVQHGALGTVAGLLLLQSGRFPSPPGHKFRPRCFVRWCRQPGPRDSWGNRQDKKLVAASSAVMAVCRVPGVWVLERLLCSPGSGFSRALWEVSPPRSPLSPHFQLLSPVDANLKSARVAFVAWALKDANNGVLYVFWTVLFSF